MRDRRTYFKRHWSHHGVTWYMIQWFIRAYAVESLWAAVSGSDGKPPGWSWPPFNCKIEALGACFDFPASSFWKRFPLLQDCSKTEFRKRANAVTYGCWGYVVKQNGQGPSAHFLRLGRSCVDRNFNPIYHEDADRASTHRNVALLKHNSTTRMFRLNLVEWTKISQLHPVPA